jgi:signal peptidase II
MRKYFIISLSIVILDQITKILVKTQMSLNETHQLVGDFLRLTFVENPGMAFGINLGVPVILSVFSLIASIFIIYLLNKSKKQLSASPWFKLSLALILGGAIGNFIDRTFYGLIFNYAPLCYGKVVDFVDVDIPDINIFNFSINRFYVFNVADSGVSIGMFLLLIFYPKTEVIDPKIESTIDNLEIENKNITPSEISN